MMRSQDVADKQKTEPLPLRLGREEWREDMSGYRRRYAMTIVGNNEFGWRGRDGDVTFPLVHTLYSIFCDVDKYLLEKNGVKMNGYGFVGQTEVNMDVRLRTQVFEEGAAGFHLFAEVAELQLRLRNLYYFGKAGDKGRESDEPFACTGLIFNSQFSIFN